MKKARVISAFPACGKTYLFNSRKDLDILDSDSSKFSWINKDGKKIRNPAFPNNYIKHIKENIGKVDFIFVSSHKDVRKALDDAGVEFYVVYPEDFCRAAWIGRCFLRGSGADFCQMLADNWNDWISEMQECALTHKHYVLGSYEYLSNAIDSFLRLEYNEII